MKTNFKIGLGLSLGAMVVALATINAVEDNKEKKYERDIRIAEINAGVKPKNQTQNKTNNKKGNNKK